MDLNNKIVAITGGARGLGYAMALELGRHGAKLALLDVIETQLNDAVETLAKADISARAYVTDVSNEEQVDSTFSNIISDFGQLDGLINNAGILRDGLLIKTKDGAITKRMSLDNWQTVINVNLTGVFLCGRAAAGAFVEQSLASEDFKENGGGVIVNISSISRAGNFGQTNYVAAKAGVVGMTTTWAKELARYGVRCAAIAPGFIATEMTASMPPDALAKISASIPIGRMGEAQEIASTVRFIFENDFISGRTLEIDGASRI